MSAQLSKPRIALFSITLWISALLIAWQTVLVVVVNDLYIAFPADGVLVTALVSWPAAVTALVSVLAGWLMNRMSTKAEMVISCILVGVGAVVVYIPTIEAALICSFSMAIGAGFANTAAMELVSQVFTDEKRRANHMGYYNAANAASGIVLAMGSGFLALNGWNCSFNLYWIAVALIVLVMLFIPYFPAGATADVAQSQHIMGSDADGSRGDRRGARRSLGARFWTFFLSMFLCYTAYCFFFGYSSVYVAENGLGDSVFTGTLTSVLTTGGLIGTLLFGRIYAKLGRKYGIVCFIVQFIVFAMVWSIQNQVLVLVSAFLFGFTYFSSLAMVFAYAADVVATERRGFAIGLMTCCTTAPIPVGCNLAPFAMEMNGGLLTPTFPLAMGILVVPIAIEVVMLFRERVAAKRPQLR